MKIERKCVKSTVKMSPELIPFPFIPHILYLIYT